MQNFANNEFDGYVWDVSIFQTPNDLEQYILDSNIVGKSIIDAKFVGMEFEHNNPWNIHARIDEPVLFQLNDGRQLDFLYSDGSTVHCGFDSISPIIRFAGPGCRFNAKIYFRNVLGARIDNIVVNKTNEEPDFTGALGIHLNDDETQEEFIESVVFQMSNGYDIHFTSWLDFGDIIVKENYERKRNIKK